MKTEKEIKAMINTLEKVSQTFGKSLLCDFILPIKHLKWILEDLSNGKKIQKWIEEWEKLSEAMIDSSQKWDCFRTIKILEWVLDKDR